MANKIIVTKTINREVRALLKGKFSNKVLSFFSSMDLYGGDGVLTPEGNKVFVLPMWTFLYFDSFPFVQRDHIIVEYPEENVITDWKGLVGLTSYHCEVEVDLEYGNAHINPIDDNDITIFPPTYLTTHTFYNAESCRGITEMMNSRYGFDVLLRCPCLYSVKGKNYVR